MNLVATLSNGTTLHLRANQGKFLLTQDSTVNFIYLSLEDALEDFNAFVAGGEQSYAEGVAVY
jgi:hypothetical protein